MDVLITAAELAQRLSDPRLRILDVRWTVMQPDGRAAFRDGHIPGAVFVDLDADLSDHSVTGRGRHPLPTAAALQASAARQEATRIGQATGERTVLDVLHADNDHAAATLALAQARSRLLLAQLQLAQLAGTLDEAALQQANQAFAQAPKP